MSITVCPLLTGTLNSMVSWTSLTVGGVANYMCNDGFELVGNMMRTCQRNLMWSGEEPMCRRTSAFFSYRLKCFGVFNGFKLAELPEYT